MPKTQEEINYRERYGIPMLLKQFDLKLSSLDNKRIMNDKNISCSDYIDSYLQPLVLTFLKAHHDSREDDRFELLLVCCFRGDVSGKIWDDIWSHLTEEEKIYYTTTTYGYAGAPLEIAINSGNIDAIVRLNTIYEELLNKYPKRKFLLHWQIRCSLIHPRIKSEKSQQCFNSVLDLCNRYAKPINIEDTKNCLSNKQLDYKRSNAKLEEGSTTLLDMFSDICEDLIFNQNIIPLKHICSYLVKNGITQDEFFYFNTRVEKKLNRLKRDNFETNFIKAATEILAYTKPKTLFINKLQLDNIKKDISYKSYNGLEKSQSTSSITRVHKNQAIHLKTSYNSISNLSSSSLSNEEMINHSKSNLPDQDVIKINNLIKNLEDETKSFWRSSNNKEKKREEAKTLKLFLALTTLMDVKDAFEKMNTQFKEINNCSTQVTDLLRSIEGGNNYYSGCSTSRY
jgi:hypothetical protein